MVGPSSSHTAGACKIGQFARALFNHTPTKATFQLHGSFGSVYKGHATDRAVLSGVMKFKTSDPRMKDALELATQRNIDYKFEVVDLGEDVHPNTVRIVLEADGIRPMSVTGSSIGGGNITITAINDVPVEVHSMVGKYKTLVACHYPDRTIIEKLTEEIEKTGVEIESVESSQFDDDVITVFNLEGDALTLSQIYKLEDLSGVDFVRSLHKVAKDE
jgi:L-serine dehydratase